MTQAYNLIAIISFSLAILGMGATAYLWFKFKILDIINDLSGKTARRSIAQLRRDNEKSGIKIHRATVDAYRRGKITEEIEKVKESPPKEKLSGTPTEKLEHIDFNATDVLTTEELAEAAMAQTSDKEACTIEDGSLQTTAELANSTGDMETEQLTASSPDKGKLKIIQEIIKVHTDEKI